MTEIAFDHIAFGVSNMADAADFLVGHLGGRPYEGGPGPGYTGAQWEFEGGGRLEVIEPLGSPDGFLHRYIADRGPGIHHVTFVVPDIRTAAARAKTLGYDVVGYQDTHPSWKEAFLHPKQAGGIVVQMAQKGPEGDGEWGSGFEFPGPDSVSFAPVRVVGLRINGHDAAAAERQWGELLGGRPERGDGETIYQWPGSPMRVRATLDTDHPVGPVSIEVRGGQAAGLSGDPIVGLGARFEAA